MKTVQLLRALTGYSFRGSGFDSQNPQGGSQPSVTPVLEDLMLYSGFCGHEAYVWYIFTHVGKTLINIK